MSLPPLETLYLVGAILLGLALAYGILRARKPPVTEKRMTEQATRDLYHDAESRDSS